MLVMLRNSIILAWRKEIGKTSKKKITQQRQTLEKLSEISDAGKNFDIPLYGESKQVFGWEKCQNYDTVLCL